MSGHSKWSTIKRKKGVNDANIPQLIPNAILWGVSGILFNLIPTYSIALEIPLKENITSWKNLKTDLFSLLLNNSPLVSLFV